MLMCSGKIIFDARRYLRLDDVILVSLPSMDSKVPSERRKV